MWRVHSQHHKICAQTACRPSSLPPATKLDYPPTSEELMQALNKMNRGKADGRTGILPELLLYGGAELQDRLLLLIEDIWKKVKVVKDWQLRCRNSPHTQEDLRKCEIGGISLLGVVEKVCTRILQDRLEVMAKMVLPESQCGFQKGRRCKLLTMGKWLKPEDNLPSCAA